MSDVCPRVDQARVKQFQDAVRIMYEKKGPEDESNSIGNVIGCMSTDLNNALIPLEDLDSANTSIPDNVDEETIAATQSIFSEMFRENIGNSENEKEFVSFAMKMVFAITNHLDNSSSADKVDPRVEELVGGVRTRRTAEPAVPTLDTDISDENNFQTSPNSSSSLAKGARELTTTVVTLGGDAVGAILTASVGVAKAVTLGTAGVITDKVADVASRTGTQIRDKVADVASSGVETVVEFVDVKAIQPIMRRKRIVSKDITQRIESITGNMFYKLACNLVILYLACWFFNTLIEKYYYQMTNSLDLLYDNVNIVNELLRNTTTGRLSLVAQQLKRLTAIPGLENCGIYDLNTDTNTWSNYMKTMSNVYPVPVGTLSCARKTLELQIDGVTLDMQRSIKYGKDIVDMLGIGGGLSYLVGSLYKNLQFKRTIKSEVEQSAGKKSRRRKAKKAKKKTRKNHKKKTRKSGKKKAKKSTTKRR